jgi:hypothetical protein
MAILMKLHFDKESELDLTEQRIPQPPSYICKDKNGQEVFPHFINN